MLFRSFTDSAVLAKIQSGNFGSEGTITDDFGNRFPSGQTETLTVEDGTYTPIATGENIVRVGVDKENETSATYRVVVDL